MRFKKDYAMAVERTKNGEIVTLLNLSRTVVYHKLRFDRGGIWIQSGGIYGKADRKDDMVCITTRARRIAKERARVASQRGLSED